jgi:hypothetical protein
MMIAVNFVSQGGHGGKGIIKDDMELGRNMLDAGIEDEWN